jgi:hypothetical protein
MFKNKFGLSVLVGFALAAPLTALSYLANKALDLPFFAFTFFNRMTPLIPGPLITFGIDLMIDTLLFLRLDVANLAKTAEQGMAVAIFIGLMTFAGAVVFGLYSSGMGGWKTSRYVQTAGWLLAGGSPCSLCL